MDKVGPFSDPWSATTYSKTVGDVDWGFQRGFRSKMFHTFLVSPIPVLLTFYCPSSRSSSPCNLPQLCIPQVLMLALEHFTESRSAVVSIRTAYSGVLRFEYHSRGRLSWRSWFPPVPYGSQVGSDRVCFFSHHSRITVHNQLVDCI